MKIDIAPNGVVLIRETFNGVYHRRIINPGDDYSTEIEEIRSVCEKTHTPEVIAAYIKQTFVPEPSPEEKLAAWRASAKCSQMQGILALGEENWNKVLTYRDVDATWAEKVVINSARDWYRNSEDIQFFAYLLGFDDAQVDALFEAAMKISA